ncbi:hypothetical protein AGDE_13421 [Angomonas deanei]|uniref:Integral membrane bound transporter domain-containing protein n=1 Tax=Angomonas deanei TaxID=59799 RepID=A0A7G2CB19_9TRYP|nr:hypothetical protein AGDE_13421 [Angomonas deanei]CAD2216271.1 hypothetical protein, conserved [Angomonas deanei]|eukprot:EPY22357.1 hypothetical protein AGDE_13421 [Angomonas deanei]
MAPNDVLNNIKFDAMCERAQVLSDLVDKKRAEIFFVQKLTKDETNYFLRVFAFCMGLVNIANKLRDFEQQCVNFDKSKYPSIWKRAFDFFFYEMWVDFWGELPKRMTWATNRDVRMWKDGIRYTLGFAVACAFTLNYDKENVYFFGMAILVRLAQQTASETIFIGVQRICGLAIGASLAVITQGKTHNLAEKTLLTMTWEFIAMSLANHPQFGQMAQYVAVITITGQALAITPSVLLTRITDNVFAFISYFLICVIIFPVDPIRMLWNTRTKLFIMTNQITQNMVTLISAPVTTSGESVKFLTKKNAADLKSMLGMLAVYEDWMTKSVGEPTIRGGVYPARAVSKVLTTLTEILALHEALHHSVEILHRPRTTAVQVMVRDVMELIRPFVLDVGKLYHSYLQELIDSTEFPVHWTMENSVRILWKAHIACRMLRHMTGNIQRNFYAAIQQVSGNERKNLNFYLNSSVIESALASGTLPPELLNPENEEMLERLFAMSFHMNDESVLLREDLHAFNIIVTVFQLELKMLEDLILPMIEIHEFEKSRVT